MTEKIQSVLSSLNACLELLRKTHVHKSKYH